VYSLSLQVPAIVSPDSIDVDMVRKDPEQSSVMRRGLLLVAKVIQSLANNVLFGKEVHSRWFPFGMGSHIDR